MSHQRFLVEFDRRTVGVAVRVPGGFMFFSSSDAFDTLDGRLFRRARALERQLAKVAASKRSSPRAPSSLRRLTAALRPSRFQRNPS